MRVDKNFLDALFENMDDESVEDALMELGLDPDALVIQIAHAEAVAEAALAAPFGGGLLALSPHENAMVHGIDSIELLSHVKQALLRVYPAELDVLFVADDEDDPDDARQFKLSELDEQEPDAERMLYLPASDALNDGRTMQSVQQIIARLRAPGGCPWDREQTHQSLTRYMIEEAYEAVEAIETGGPSELAEELGDVLLQILLHAQIAEEHGTFSLEDVFEILASKMIRRHPHVFGDRSVETSGEVVTAWDQIKRQEYSGQAGEDTPSIFGSIPPSLPALARAQTMLRRSESHGIDFEQISERVATALRESGDANEAHVAEQLVAIARDARAQGIDGEGALRRWTECFEKIANEAVTETK